MSKDNPTSGSDQDTSRGPSTKVVIVLGILLFTLGFGARATNFGLRVLGLSVQEWCLFTYAAVLLNYDRHNESKVARIACVACCVLAYVVLVVQMLAWIENESFVLLQLP